MNQFEKQSGMYAPQGLIVATELASQIASIAESLGLALLEAGSFESGLCLFFDEEGLALQYSEPGKKPMRLRADFLAGKTGFRLGQAIGRHQPLAKAVGAHKKLPLNIIDLTAGLGRDSMVLALLGCHVTMLERQPVVAALLADGLRRAQANSELSQVIDERIKFIQQDGLQWLAQADVNRQESVVYYDPMYPKREKSSLVKKEMRLFQHLIGADHDVDENFLQLCQMGFGRIVVKRPRYADCIANSPPTHQIVSKSTRWDVYLPGVTVSSGKA